MPTPAFASIEIYKSGSPLGEKEIKRLSWVSIFSIDFLLKLLYNIYVRKKGIDRYGKEKICL